jgi:LysM repeat protein
MKTKSVDDSRKIINEPLFEKVNRALTDIAIERYGLKTNGQLLFDKTSKQLVDERTSTYRRNTTINVERAEPNESLFQQLQVLKSNYDSAKAIADQSIMPDANKAKQEQITLEFNSGYDDNSFNLDIVRNGTKVGDINYKLEGNIATVDAVEIYPEYRNQGIAIRAYKELNKSLSRTNIALRSGNLNENSTGVWKGLVRRGFAKEINPGSYEYTNYKEGEQLTLFQLENEKVLEPAIKELDNYLLEFLKPFGVKSKEFADLKSKLGVDALGATDVLNKLIWYSTHRNAETLPEEAAHMIVMLMGEQNKAIKYLIDNITTWSEYSSVKAQYMPLYNNEKQVKIEAVGKLIAKALVKNYKASGLDKSLLDKALELLYEVFEKLRGIYKNNILAQMEYNDRVADHIAINVLMGDKDYIAKLATSTAKLDYEKALSGNEFAQHIINVFSKLDAKLTGSLAIAAQGDAVYRSSEEPIHDIDFSVKNKEDYEVMLEKVESINGVPYHYGWDSDAKGYTTYAFLIPKEGLTVEVLGRDFTRGNGWLTAYNLRDKDGNIVKPTSQNHMAVDFFVHKDNVDSGNSKGIHKTTAVIFKGKLSLSRLMSEERMFARPKDQQDYVLHQPTDLSESFPQFTYFQLNSEEPQTLNIDLESVNNARTKEVAEVLAKKLAAQMNTDFFSVSPEEAQKILENSSKPYMGEPAFYFAGGVYFVGDNVNINTVLHEFSHPFIQGIRRSNPELFENLFASLSETDEGQAIIAHVKKLYPELGQDTPLFKEEVLVYALQLDAVNKVNDKVASEGFESFINQLLAALKKFLRGIFGNGVNVKNLSSTTTISDLGDILLSDEEIDLDLGTKPITEADVVMYYKEVVERAEDLLKNSSPEAVQSIVNYTYLNGKATLNKAREFNTGKDSVNKAMLQRALLKEGNTELLPAVDKSLKGFQDVNPTNNVSPESIIENAINAEEKLQELALIKATALVNSIDRIKSASINTLGELRVIDENASLINNRNVVALLALYSSTANSWIGLINEINEILEDYTLGTDSLFYQTLNEVLNNSTMIVKKIGEIYKKNNVQLFVQITGYMTDFVQNQLNDNLKIALKKLPLEEQENEVTDLYNKVISNTITDADLERLYQKGVPKEVLDRFVQQYNTYVLNEDKISDILSGKTKDVSWFNRWLESYSSSNDPIVGSLAMYIQNEKTEVENEVWNKSQIFRNVLAKLLPQVNFSKLNSLQIRDMVATRDTIFYIDKQTGKPAPKEVYTFLNEFGNGWRYEKDNLEYEYALAKDSGDKEKTAEALDRLRQFNKAYMWQEFVPELYEKDDIFNESEIGKLAYLAKKTAFDNFLNLQNQFEKELERFENYSTIEAAFRAYQQLYSLHYEDATEKVDDPANGIYDKSIAELLIKHRNATSEFYEWVPIPNSLSTAYNEFVTELEAKRIKRDDPKFQTELRKWEKQNIKIKYSQEFYERRANLLNRLTEIQKNMRENMNLDFDISGAYKTISDLIFTYRDEFGQPDAGQLGNDRLEKIKNLEQDIVDFRSKFDYRTGLSKEDAGTLSFLLEKSKVEDLDTNEAMLLNDLIQKQKAKGVDVELVEEMTDIFNSLSNLSSNLPTEYYLDALNMRLSKFNVVEVTETTVDNFINSEEFTELLVQDEELRKWFNINHIEVKRYDKGKEVDKFQRTSANSVMRPKEGKYYETTTIFDNETGEEVTLLGVPNARHSRREVKDKYRTIPRGAIREDYIGKYVDNKGEYLPRLFQPGTKYSAVDDRFIDKRYQALKANPESPEFKLLEAIKEHHLDMQKNGSNYGKLYMDVPRYSTKKGDFYQAFQKGQYGDKFKNINSNVKEWLKQKFGKSTEDYLNDLNYDADNNLVNTDLNGDEISYIPVTGIFNLDADVVDADIFNSLFRYALSLQTQKQLYKSLPLVKSIISTLEDPKNQPKNLQKKSKQLQDGKNKVRAFVNLKTDTYNRLEQIRSLIDREYFGRKVVGMEEANPRLTKWLSNLTKWSSRSSLMMNIPSDLKNQFSGYVQTIIESSGGRFVTGKDLALSSAWATKAMMDWAMNGMYTTGPGNLSSQLVQIFDPNFKTTDEYGNTVYKSLFKDLMNFEWTYMHRKFGEMDVAMRLFGAFLYGQKLEQDLISGDKATIRYVDAWETDENGVARLKAGIHPGWSNLSVYHTYQKGESLEEIAKKYNVTVEELKAKNRIKSQVQLTEGQEIVIAKSEKYKLFKNRLQGTSRALFGVYDDFGQPEGNKLLLYRMFFFMRKWFTPMFTNRFGMDTSKENFGGARYDWALGKTTKGFYVNSLQVIYRGLKSKGVEFQFMTEDEKADLRRAMAEGMIVTMSALLASLLFGYEDGDEDRWKKIKERSGPINSDNFNTYGFLTNHALLLLLGVQAETGAFIPLPKITVNGVSINLGADDYSKLLTSTSTAFSNTVLTYMEIFGDILNFATASDANKYKKDVGPYWFQKKGENKIYKRVFSLLGFSGGTGDPETLLKNLSKSGGRIR